MSFFSTVQLYLISDSPYHFLPSQKTNLPYRFFFWLQRVYPKPSNSLYPPVFHLLLHVYYPLPPQFSPRFSSLSLSLYFSSTEVSLLHPNATLPSPLSRRRIISLSLSLSSLSYPFSSFCPRISRLCCITHTHTYTFALDITLQTPPFFNRGTLRLIFSALGLRTKTQMPTRSSTRFWGRNEDGKIGKKIQM